MSDTWQQAWGQVVAQAWSDDGYRQRLLSDPAAALQAQGLSVPAGKQIRIIEDTDDTVHVILPARPTELSDEDLDQAAGGAGPKPPSGLDCAFCNCA
jgi:hypothetical protein